MVGIDTETRARMMKAAQHFRVEWVENGSRLAIIDPTQMVDGEPREVATLDLRNARELNAFLMLLVAPSLTAAGLDPEKIFGQKDSNTEGVDD